MKDFTGYDVSRVSIPGWTGYKKGTRETDQTRVILPKER